MLLVFGGTTEGKRCAAALAEAGLPFIYSTKLPVVMPELPGMRLRHGPLTVEALTALCHAEKVRAIVNASHPFAEVLHATVAAADRIAEPIDSISHGPDNAAPDRPTNGTCSHK